MTTTEQIDAAFRAGFQAGFRSTREGFNAHCAYPHLAPEPFSGDDDHDPVPIIEDAALAAFRDGDIAFESFLNSLDG